MVVSILPVDPHPRGQKIIIELFQNIVLLHIKFIGITKCSNMVAFILPAVPSPY